MSSKYSDVHTILPRVLSLDDRIKRSEPFPRIRDAEREMMTNEQNFQRQQLSKHKKRIKKQAKDAKQKIEENSKHFSEVEKTDDFFSAYSLDKDPKSSKYMPYHEVYFPKLFNPSSSQAAPDAIHSVWLLAYEDHYARKEAAQLQAEAHLVHKPSEKERKQKALLSPGSLRSVKAANRFHMYKT